MEHVWRKNLVFLSLFCLPFVGCYPINNSAIDSHTQYLTVLVAVFLTICSVVLLTGCLCCQRRKGFKEFRDTTPVVNITTSNLDYGHVNPIANGEFIIFTPLSQHYNNNVALPNKTFFTDNSNELHNGETNIIYWPGSADKDFPRDKLKYICELGKGWFGKVVEGLMNDRNDSEKWMPVVVRILEASATSQERLVFLHDVSIYHVGEHPNILQLFGHCLDTIPLLILQEFCSQGDLKKYLKENKNCDKFLTSEYPLIWCCQLTSALKHLHDRGVIHPDLAARNCQLTDNLTLKLGDYGLAVFQYPADYYQGLPGVSIRWCAPETINCTNSTIQPKKITAESNVWSIGVTMWEIFECGKQPYGELNDDEVISQVFSSNGLRLSRPTFQLIYTDYIYRLMQLCWLTAESRPLVNTINLMLNDLYQVQQNTNCINLEEFDKRWNGLKSNNVDISNSLNTNQASLNEIVNTINNTADNVENVNTEPEKCIISTQSSSSEDENWSIKVERGIYSEKVRQKSKSVTDLMVLTHINLDYSESENETSLPSLVYKNRLGGSENDLLKIYDNDYSGLFEQKPTKNFMVPEINVNSNLDANCTNETELFTNDFTAPVDVKSLEQEFNINTKLETLRNATQVNSENDRNDYCKPDLPVAKEKEFDNDNSTNKSANVKISEENLRNSSELEIAANNCEAEKSFYHVPKLTEIIQNNDTLVDYILDHYDEDVAQNLTKSDENDERDEGSKSAEENIRHNKNSNLLYNSTEYSNPENLNLKCSLDEDINEDSLISNEEQLNYSLETWSNFLGETMDNRDDSKNFDVFNTNAHEHSITYQTEDQDNKNDIDLNATYVVHDFNEATDINPEIDKVDQFEEKGWFLHPQGLDKHDSELKEEKNSSESRIDEEIMAAIRSELMIKLPHAQGNSSEYTKNEEDLEDNDEELFIYNKITNGSLSPILEEDETELNKNWPKYEHDINISDNHEDTEVNLSHNNLKTAVQNNIGITDDGDLESNTKIEFESQLVKKDTSLQQEEYQKIKESLEHFLNVERNNTLPTIQVTGEVNQDNNYGPKCSEKSVTAECELSIQDLINKQTVPLPSPEDHQWKALIHFNEKLKTLSSKTDFVISENEKNRLNSDNSELAKDSHSNSLSDASDDFEHNTFIVGNNSNEDETSFDSVFADIRFIGPTDSQLMSTSFSESNYLNDNLEDMDEDEQDWDNDSENKSSSSGEFIWQLKDEEKNDFSEKIDEETDESDDDDVSSENTEFVPSAWDKYAIPTKSVLKSPDTTLSKSEKKSKGVWFKEQKHHCIYEYPREQESPILHNADLGQFSTDFGFEGNFHQMIPDVDQMVYNNSTFDINTCSQFFPSAIFSENMTPDSGIDDITESITQNEFPNDVSTSWEVRSLKELALDMLKDRNCGVMKKEIGGLRHTKNKLKLDLPSISPTFNLLSNKIFSTDANERDSVSGFGQKANSTFSKNRFSVQQVYTPPNDEITQKNVSFEVLPHKPTVALKNDTNEINRIEINPLTQNILLDDLDSSKGNVESVEGEAILLDSADEDSGIESNALDKPKLTE